MPTRYVENPQERTTCQYPGCKREFKKWTKNGRERKFCSNEHRAAFWRETSEAKEAPRIWMTLEESATMSGLPRAYLFGLCRDGLIGVNVSTDKRPGHDRSWRIHRASLEDPNIGRAAGVVVPREPKTEVANMLHSLAPHINRILGTCVLPEPESSRIERAVLTVMRCMIGSVAWVRWNHGQTFEGDDGIFFRIVLRDEVAKEKKLRYVVEPIEALLIDAAGFYGENPLPRPYFNYRTESEQAKLKEPEWEPPLRKTT